MKYQFTKPKQIPLLEEEYDDENHTSRLVPYKRE